MSIKSYISKLYHKNRLKRDTAKTIRGMRIDESEQQDLEKDYWKVCKTGGFSIHKFVKKG